MTWLRQAAVQLTLRSAVASSRRVKCAIACVLSRRSLRSAYSRTFAMMKSENCTLHEEHQQALVT